ncbi:MAG: response regulator [Polyangiales bacterium]
MGEGSATSKAVVIVADDDKSTCDHIAGVLRSADFEVVAVYGGQKAVDAVRAHEVDLVILDVGMPGLGGIDACRVIKKVTEGTFVPVILLTVQGDLNGRVQGLRTGADDHIAKPVDDASLLEQVQNMLRVKRAHDDVQDARSKLRHTSLHEQLKTLPDHRDFHEALRRGFDAAARHLDPMACCIIAIEDFRRIAKKHGLEFASQVLDTVSRRLRRAIPENDIVAQFRTAEFGLLLPKTRPARALTLADRLVSEVALRPIEIGDHTLDLQVAIGVGLFPSAGVRSHSELLDAASIAVARARVAGPNRICVVQHQGYIFRPTLPGAA